MSEVASLDPAVFDARYAELFADLRRVCLALGGADDSDDLAQEAILDGRSQLAQLRDDASLIPWLRKIAARRTTRVRDRRRSRESAAAPKEFGADAFGSVDLSIDERQALGRLPRRQRELVALVYFADYSQAEAAAILGISRGTVARTLWEARVTLARTLADHGPERRGER